MWGISAATVLGLLVPLASSFPMLLSLRMLEGMALGGIPAIAIFPHINAAKKNEGGEEALNAEGLIPTVIQAMKAAAPEVGIACDVARRDRVDAMLRDRTVGLLCFEADPCSCPRSIGARYLLARDPLASVRPA